MEEEDVDVVAVTDVGAVTGAGAGLVVVVVGFVSASACDSGVDDDDVVVVVVGLLWFPAASDCCNCADIIFSGSDSPGVPLYLSVCAGVLGGKGEREVG